MNERIRELEDQCWEDVPVDIDYDYLSRVRRVFNRGKFAELIVRECANVAVEAESVGVARMIMIHFGVEQ